MNANKPILVTGSHHSGTTWVGKMIAASPSVGYIHEPFNPIHRLGMCSANFEQWFYYINSENAASYYSKFRDTVEFKYNLLAQLTDPNLSRGFKVAIYNYRQAIKDYQVFQRYRLLKKRPLLKDPIAIFSAEWLAETFDMDVVVLVRHPAAFISSLKRQNETYPFSHFLQQPLLMRDHLYLFEEQIREYSKEERSIIDQGILLWKIIHQVIMNYQAKHENWLFLRHEDISRSPLDYFQRIFEKLGLMFQDEVKECIENYSKHSNPKAAPDNSSSIKLDSKANIWNWKTRLTEEEISYIRSQLKGIAEKFYCDTDW